MPTESDALVAIYPSHSEAETAVKELQKSGFDLKKLSLIGRDHHTEEHLVGFYNTGDRVGYWGKTGAFWGAMWGMLMGSAFFFLPGVGPILIAGPLAGWVIGALEGAVLGGGITAFSAALISLGIPRDRILQYETALTAGKCMLVIHGTATEAAHAKEIIGRFAPEALVDHRLQGSAVPTMQAGH